MMQQYNTIIATPLQSPDCGRIEMEMPAGLTIAEVVARAFPVWSFPRETIRVVLVAEGHAMAILPEVWDRVRSKPGVQIVLRPVPGKDNIGSILAIVVSVAAVAFAPAVVGALGFAGNQFALAAVTAGLSVIGQLLVTALVPTETGSSDDAKDTYSINGWRNEVRPGQPVPYPLGRIRYAPPFAARSYTEIVGDDQYVRALFTFGYGALRISDLRIGETSIEDYEDIDVEIREGRPSDLPVTLYPRQVLEEAHGIDLVRPWQRDESGDPILPDRIFGIALPDPEFPSIETPVTRFTAANSTEASVLLGFNGGLFKVDDEGDTRSLDVRIRIRARLNGIGNWELVENIKISAGSRTPFVRQHTWTLSTRGRWQIEVTRMTSERTSSRTSDKVQLVAIQSIRPEYPINLDTPLALVALRIRATSQLNGGLDSFNALIEREGLVHDQGAWLSGYGRTPATAYLSALTGPANPYPASLEHTELDRIADWHDWCVSNGLKYDRVHDQAESLGNMLAAICAAGRATYRHDGLRWGVVIDRPETLVIDHINTRNSSSFSWQRSYFNPPDGMRVRFLDETNEYGEAERIIPWPGFTGDIKLTEELSLPGKTDPDEIWTETRRRMYELLHRPDTFSATQDGAIRLATRGDLVMGSFDVLDKVMTSARVKAVHGNLIVLDELTEVGTDYGMRFKAYQDEDDLVGVSMVRDVIMSDAVSEAVSLKGDGYVPSVNEVVHLGPKSTESLPLRLKGVEAGQDFTNRLIMVSAAPQIDELLDADIPPPWDGRVGEEVDGALVPPAVPVFTSITSGIAGTDDPDLLRISIAPGFGSTTPVQSFTIETRLASTVIWNSITVPVASSSAEIDLYEAGDAVEIRADAVAANLSSGYTGILRLVIGGDDPEVPAALDSDSILVAGHFGYSTVGITVPEGSTAEFVQLYRAPSGTSLDRSIHAIGARRPATAGATLTVVDGDGTRRNLWDSIRGQIDVGPGWTVDGAIAAHAPPDPGALSQALDLSAGKTYRLGFDLASVVGGGLTPQLRGGTTVSGVTVRSNGRALQTLVANAGSNSFAVQANGNFDGAVSGIVLFLETESCIGAGEWNYYIEPINGQNVAGPLAGPFNITIY